jgi:hypothetical protein
VGIRVRDGVGTDGVGGGNAEIGGLVTVTGVDTGADTDAGGDTGANTGAVGAPLMVKHPWSGFCSQLSSVMIATSGISVESVVVEFAGNVADVLHMYRIPSFPYKSKGLLKLNEASAHSK